MGYFSCNANSATTTCQWEWDPFCWEVNTDTDTNTAPKPRNSKGNKKKLPNMRKFEYSDLVEATNGFSADNFLGKGSHGSVYRATLDDGKLIAAVKTSKFKKPSATNHRPNCTNCTSPAENEIHILSSIPTSRRIVNLIGHCTDPYLNKLIVVDFMPNGSLHDLLHSIPTPPAWAPRIRFALQVAEAVGNLHCSKPPVIHRDIKSSNVLIDGEWNARIGDFGLALRGEEAEFGGKSSRLPAGTLGYIDPCYLAPGDLSEKSDVFSFGILLLEIISGRKAIDVKYSPASVVEWALPLIKQGEFDGIRDRRIGTPSDPTVVERLAVLAGRCVRWKAEKRPAMAEVVECLKQVRKMTHGWRMWGRVKRRVGRTEREVSVNGLVKMGSRRRNGKVSSVCVGDDHERSEAGNYDQVVVRSKSIGCEEGEMKMKRNQSGSDQPGLFVRRKEELRLKKSRSVGVSHSPRLLLGLGRGRAL